MRWDEHRKRRALRPIALVHAFATNVSRSVDDVNGGGEAGAVDAFVESLALRAAQETELENDARARFDDSFRDRPDPFRAARGAFDVPFDDALARTVGTEELGHPFVECEANGALVARKLERERRFAGANRPDDEMDTRGRFA